ncbi:MAG: DPP IV N-terminal domain-containing protein [Acidobacteriota bacterium]|nr:DPP IV N-terminal domain-containing protein [Acidobacteriota bacterium]
MKSKNFIRRLVLPCALLTTACLPVLAFLGSPTAILNHLQLLVTAPVNNTSGNIKTGSENRERATLNLPALKFTSTASNGKIAFNSLRTGVGEIFTMDANGTNQTNISNNNGEDVSCQWSPDGSKIAFVSEDNGNIDIYTMNADGSNQTRLTTNRSLDDTPSWSPDGTKIVFASDRDGRGLEIYLMNADGSNQKRLTNNSRIDYYPKFSPDGNKIAFTSHRAGNAEIWMMDADGLNAVNLTNDASDDFEPTWSPDSSWIAFTSYRSGNGEIWLMDLNGNSPINLTNNPADDYQPAWSPDGTKIAFSSQRNENIDVYVMNADGSNQTRLTNDASDSYFPSWQPVFYLNIFGTVRYGITPENQAPRSVSEVQFSATGTTTDSASSDSSGAYSLSNLVSGGQYTVTPSKTGNASGITAFDATLILRCVSAGSNCALTTNQRIAANTDGDGGITAFDATQILRFVATNGSNADMGQVGNWKFDPVSKPYSNLTANQPNQDYTAFLIGEVDGDWAP